MFSRPKACSEAGRSATCWRGTKDNALALLRVWIEVVQCPGHPALAPGLPRPTWAWQAGQGPPGPLAWRKCEQRTRICHYPGNNKTLPLRVPFLPWGCAGGHNVPAGTSGVCCRLLQSQDNSDWRRPREEEETTVQAGSNRVPFNKMLFFFVVKLA